MSVNLGQLAATTLRNYRKTMVDNIFKDNVLLNHIMANGGVEYEDGGRQIVVPLMYGENDTVMPFSGTDLLDVTPQEGIDAATYDWKMYNVAVAFSKEDELKNKGKSAVIKLLKKKIMQAEMSLKSRLNEDLFDGTESNSKEITGLSTIMDNTSTTYGNIDGTTYTWWQAFVDSTAEVLSIADIRTGRNTVNLGEGGGKCSIMVTSQELHEKYEGLLTATIQMNPTKSKETKRLGDAGYSALEFAGVPVVFDERCPADRWYFLNTTNMKLTIHKDANFEVIEKAEPANQHVSISHIMVMLNTTVDRRASLGMLDGKTVS